MTQEIYLKVYSGENSPMSTQEHTFKGSCSRPLYLNKQPLLKSSSHWIWIQDLPTGGLRYSSFHKWSFPLNTLQVDTRRGLRGETGFTLFREHKICKEKLPIFSVRAWEKLTPTVYCVQERSWRCPSGLDVSGQLFQKRQPSGACDSEKKPRHPPSTCLGGDPDGEWDCWPQSFLSDKRHACCTKPSTNQLYISENRWVFHGIIVPWGARPFIWIQQVKANVVSSFLYEEFLGFRFIVQNNHLARAPLKRSGGLILHAPHRTQLLVTRVISATALLFTCTGEVALLI